MDTVAVIGLATAMFAAIIGVSQNDIKKVFAYSTVSQLGYMFIGAGVGAFSAGIFHLMTHAFFKALLFLGAGSVIHALSGEQDLRQMGGLRKYTPITFITLMCAGIAIAGIPPFAGFFSKDEILAAAYVRAPWMYWLGVFTAGLTAFYVFRALFLAFFGEYRGHHHPHESPPSMTIPLVVLALLSAGGGFINVPRWLEPLFPLKEEPGNEWLMYVSVAAGAIGIVIAYICYVASPGIADALTESLSGLARLFDRIYNAFIVVPLVNISRVFLWRGVDAGLIDGFVNGVGTRSRGVGRILRLLQSGSIRSYAVWVVLGSVAVLLAIGLAGGAR
jgi:NADH-quinone oxidoreductase subunit L